jgi:hypothetical protein
MPVLRFQRTAGITATEITRQLPAGSFTSVSVPEPGHLIDLSVTAGGVNDATAFMASRGYTLFATDPVPSLEAAAASEVPPVDRMKLSDGTVLTVGACADAQVLTRSGATLIGSSGGGSSFDIRDQLVWDHFVVGNLDLDEMGVMGWRTAVAGTGSDLVLIAESGHPGVLDFGCGTVAGGRAAIFLGETSMFPFDLSASQNQLNIEWLVRFNANALLTTSLDRFTVGLGDAWDASADVEHSNGVYCEFSPGTSPNFALVTAAAAARTRTASSIVVSSSTWYRVGLRVTYPGGTPTAELLINGTVRATNTGTFPSSDLAFGIRGDGGAALEARFQADYVVATQVTAKET